MYGVHFCSNLSFSSFAWITWFFAFDRSVVRFSFSVVRSVFALVSFSFSVVSLAFSSFNLLISSLTPLSASSFFESLLNFLWVSLEDFLKKNPMKRETLIRGSRSSNLSSNFLKRSVRSLRSLFKSSSLLGGWGGWKQSYLKYSYFFLYSYFLQYEHHSSEYLLLSYIKKDYCCNFRKFKMSFIIPPLFAPSL
ncbi:hypothetical protein HPF57_0065 [Helicobacter pylori F57]|nr:hypothetical protein HPF57_0065 [Helicobacter pylori F57]